MQAKESFCAAAGAYFRKKQAETQWIWQICTVSTRNHMKFHRFRCRSIGFCKCSVRICWNQAWFYEISAEITSVHKNVENTPVRDALGILRFSAFFRSKDKAAILPLWPQLECGQAHFKNRTYNAEKPPFWRFFWERWSEWQDSNLRHPAPKAGALPTALHPVIQFIYPAGRILPNQARYQLRYTRICAWVRISTLLL